MKKIDIDEIMIKQLPIIEDEFKEKIEEVIELIKQYNPYKLLSKYMSYIKMSSALNPIDTNNDVELKFGLESMQMLMSCIREDEYNNEEPEESIVWKIIELFSNIFALKERYTLSITFKLRKENVEEDLYIFEDIERLNITGKRYGFFEIEHHKNVLYPISNQINEVYGITLDDILLGMSKYRNSFIYGFKEAINEIKSLSENVNVEDISTFEENIIEDFFEKAFLLESHNVKKITGWTEELIEVFSNNLGSNCEFLSSISVKNYLKLHNTIKSKPIIKLGSDYYCLSISRLLDDFDKNVLKDIYKKVEEKKEKIKKLISENSEVYTSEIFKKIIPKSNIYINNFYKINGNFNENDVLVIYDRTLIVVEIKAGNFTPEVAISDIESHKKTLSSLVEAADSQIEKFLNELYKKKRIEIYDDNNRKASIKCVIDVNNFMNIYKFVITLEGFNEIAARAEKEQILTINPNTIVCSIDDLEVYGDFFENKPIYFIHYIKNRTRATLSQLVELNDELDHLGLYILYNNYSLKANEIISKYGDVNKLFWEDARNDIDTYYKAKEFGKDIDIPLPNYPSKIKEIIDLANNSIIENSTYVLSLLLDYNSESINKIEEDIVEMIYLYKNNNSAKYLILSEKEMIVLSCIYDNDNFNISDLFDEIYSNMIIKSKNNAYFVILFYDRKEKLSKMKIQFLDINNVMCNRPVVEELVKSIKNERVFKRKILGKIGRNEKCPCGSGKKYKNCCGKKY